METLLHDEYQDGASIGSLRSASGHWLDLRTDRMSVGPQQFTFAFTCPSPLMAEELVRHLRNSEHMGLVTTRDGGSVPPAPWRVDGSTRPELLSLPHLEHLFMGLRRAAERFDSTLVALDLLPFLTSAVPLARS
jgi:hypothetical protein